MAESLNFEILIINRHTGYLYNLSKVGHHWSVLNEWLHYNRPFPANFEPIDWAGACRDFHKFDVAIGHSIWFDIAKFLPYCLRHRKPYIQIIHGRRALGGFSKSRLRKLGKHLYSSAALGSLVRLGLVRVVFISNYASSDWGLAGTVINQGIPLDELECYDGTEASLLVVGNMLHRTHFAFDDLVQISGQVPVKIVGENPRIPGCHPSKDWNELRSFYRRYRAYLNLTCEPENGYNLAVLEAMGSGMPVISLIHPSTPIRDGENGFLVENVSEAVERAKQLLADIELARDLGRRARETIEREFSMNEFRRRWNDILLRSIGQTSAAHVISVV